MIYQQSINNVNKLLIDFCITFPVLFFIFCYICISLKLLYKEYNMATNQWTDAERVEFLINVLNKVQTSKISHRMGRSESALRSEASRLGISLKK